MLSRQSINGLATAGLFYEANMKHEDWVHASNEYMRARLHEIEASGIKCEIQKPTGRFFSWREWFEFLGFRENGYALND